MEEHMLGQSAEPMPAPPAIGDRDKLYWEIEKLRAETEQIRRPAYLSPTTVATVVAALVALVGAGFQYRLNQLDAKEAGIEASRLKSEAEQLAGQKAEIVRSIDAMLLESEKVGAQLKNAQTQLQDVRTQLARAETQSRAATSAASSETVDALTAAQAEVADLQQRTTASERARAAQVEQLGAIRARVMAPSGLRIQP
jgi:chromosome segregation ATPase